MEEREKRKVAFQYTSCLSGSRTSSLKSPLMTANYSGNSLHQQKQQQQQQRQQQKYRKCANKAE